MIWKKTMLVLFAAISFAVIAAVYIFFFYDYSRGDRVGTIAKFSAKGSVIKTWEGQLITGGMAGNNGSDYRSPYWNFSVYPGASESIREKIKSAMDGGYRVKLTYEEKFVLFKFRGDTKYFITGVEKVKAN